jgi:hypothetical protein
MGWNTTYQKQIQSQQQGNKAAETQIQWKPIKDRERYVGQ